MSTFTCLTYHVIFGTKYRKRAIVESVEQEFHAYIGGIIKGEKGRLIEIGGVEDHIHILAGFSPTISVSEMLKRIKGNSSKWINDTKKVERRFEWQVGYGAFSVSQSLVSRVRAYIRKQKEHHKKVTFEAEFREYLHRHEIEYNPPYVIETEHVG